jgi:hypothetical protein
MFWSALRRWGERAVAAGILTIPDIKNGHPAIAATGTSEKPLPAPAHAAPPAAELLDDFLIALLELPGDTWSDIAVAFPDELFDRIDLRMEAFLS